MRKLWRVDCLLLDGFFEKIFGRVWEPIFALSLLVVLWGILGICLMLRLLTFFLVLNQNVEKRSYIYGKFFFAYYVNEKHVYG